MKRKSLSHYSKEEEGMEHLGFPVKRADAVTNRARILEVALAVFAEYGLDIMGVNKQGMNTQATVTASWYD